MTLTTAGFRRTASNTPARPYTPALHHACHHYTHASDAFTLHLQQTQYAYFTALRAAKTECSPYTTNKTLVLFLQAAQTHT